VSDKLPTQPAEWNVGAEAFLATVLDCVAQPVWVVDHEDAILFANPAAVSALGYDDASELAGRPSHQTIHYKHPDGSPFPVEECPMLAPRTTGATIHSDEDWFVRRDGSMFPVEYTSAPIDTPGGRAAVVAFTDITERRAIEQTLREHDAILSLTGQPVYVAGRDGRIRYVNPAAVRALGYDDASELIGQSAHRLLQYKSADGTPYPLRENLVGEHVVEGGETLTVEEDWLVRKDGTMLPISYTAVPIETPIGTGVVLAFSDLRERREAERAARERDIAEARAAEARAAQRRIIEAHDAARHRVTRDLHDGAQQQFVNAVINLQLAQRRWESDPARARELLADGVEQAQAGITALRELAAGIHPAILTNRGLGPAIEALAERLPLPVELHDGIASQLPTAIEATAYFLTVEALTNVVKHARASRAGVRLDTDDGWLTIDIRDDGIGGVPLRAAGGSGLSGLVDRVAAVDGTLEVHSPPGAGTTLRVKVPIPAGGADPQRPDRA
jgi:PAS domain S-box-containing protein